MIGSTKATTVPISIPTLVEQRRIVAVIEALHRYGDESLGKDSFLSKRFRRAVLAMAFSTRFRSR